MDNGIHTLLQWIEDSKKSISLRDYAKDADFVDMGDIAIGFSPFSMLSTDNYLNRRLVVFDNKYFCLETLESGDIIDYIMATKHVSFREALDELATLVGSTVPDIEGEIEERVKNNEHKERLYRLMHDTMVHYFNNLRDERAKIAVDYLEKRGFDNVLTTDANGVTKVANPIVQTFALGFSLDEYALVDAMHKKGYTNEEMDECGLVYLKGGKAYDVMAGRLIIPIINRHNKVIAFSGRIFEAKGHQKYRNTGNTILFSKKNEIYGANNLPALSHQGKINEVFVVEGYMDVISLYKEGFKNAVASMGTALTSDHARILKNYATNVYLTYDGDDAGQDAIRRGVDVLYAEGVMPKVITLPIGQDPDEIIKANGAGYFVELKRNARNMIEYKIDDLATKYNLEEADDKGEYAVKAIELLLRYASKVEAEEYLYRISEKSGINSDVLRQELYESNEARLPFNDGTRETKPLSPKERGLVYILYDMLTHKKNRKLSAYLDSDDAKMAYNYMRLMDNGASEEEFSEILDSDIALNVSMLKSMEDDLLVKASEDSMARLEQELVGDVTKRLTKAFSSENSLENKYILNECVISLTKARMKQNKRK